MMSGLETARFSGKRAVGVSAVAQRALSDHRERGIARAGEMRAIDIDRRAKPSGPTAPSVRRKRKEGAGD